MIKLADLQRKESEKAGFLSYQSKEGLEFQIYFSKNTRLRVRIGRNLEELDGEKEESQFSIQESEYSDLIFWNDLILEVDRRFGRLKISKKKVFYEDLDYQFSSEGRIRHRLRRRESDLFFGLGEKSGPLIRNSQSFRNEMMDPMGYDAQFSDPLYKFWPIVMNANPSDEIFTAIYYRSESPSLFDLGKEVHNYDGPYRFFETQDDSLDFLIFFDSEMSGLVRQVSSSIGGSVLLPKYAFGYLASTMAYTESKQPKKEFLQFFKQHDEHDLGVDVFHLSSGYSKVGDQRRLFHWDSERFGSKEEFVKDFHKNAIHLNVNFKPAVFEEHSHFEEWREKDLFLQDVSGGLEWADFWDGKAALINFGSEKANQFWKQEIKDQFLSKGFDSVWNDNNEFRLNSMKPAATAPKLCHEMAKASFELQQEAFQNRRPFVLSRSGSPGFQKFAQTWTGDNATDWKTIRWNHYMGMNLSLSGIFHFGHDIGGFSGPAPEKDLFLRWIQYGIWMPRFCIHSWNEDGSTTTPWMYEEALPAVKKLFDFRYALIPYLYHLNFEAYLHSKPIVRPLFYERRMTKDEILKHQDQFLLGDQILVQPVFEKGQIETTVHLPDWGEKWWSPTEERFRDSGESFSLENRPEDLPLHFFRENAIIPWGECYSKKRALALEELSFRIFPSPGRSIKEFQFYDDDGASRDFEKGQYSIFNLSLETDAKSVRLETQSVGKEPLSYKKISYVLPSKEKRQWVQVSPSN